MKWTDWCFPVGGSPNGRHVGKKLWPKKQSWGPKVLSFGVDDAEKRHHWFIDFDSARDEGNFEWPNLGAPKNMNTMLNKNPQMRAPILGQTQRSKLVVYPAISHRISSFGCFSSIRKIAQLNQAQLEEVRGNPVLGSRLDAVKQNSLAINIYIYG